MKVFCFVQLYHISERGGGAEVQANYLSEELANRTHEVHYICQTVNQEKVHTTTNLNGVIIHWLPQKNPTSSENFNNIKKLLLQIEADYIIERMSSSYAWPILKAKKICKSKYIWICTDNESPVLFRTLKNYYKKKSFIKFLYASIKALKIDIIRLRANKKADIIFTQNDIQKTLLKKNFKLQSHRMISGHPFPKSNLFPKERFKLKRILWCGNLGQHKRPEIFIELASQMLDSDLEFIMVGGHADKSYTSNLFSNKPNNLIATGQLSFKESLTYFDNATVLVNSSTAEGFSNTYIQAWLRGVPTLVFGANPNQVITTHNLGYDVSCVEEAKEVLNSLLSSIDNYQKQSENAVSYSSKHHSIEAMTNNFLEVLNEKSI